MPEFTQEQVERAQRRLEEQAVRNEASGLAPGEPVPPELRAALRPLLGDRRWASDQLAEVAAWCFDQFRNPNIALSPEARACSPSSPRCSSGCPWQPSGHAGPPEEILRDPVTGRVEGDVAMF